jgi:hypothetical protein
MARAGGNSGLQAGDKGQAFVTVADAGTRPAGGVATGELVKGALQDEGVVTERYRWVYGPALRQTFHPHLALDGTEFDNFDDPQLVNGQSFPPYGYYFPGDHTGCICDFEPIIPAVEGVAPVAPDDPFATVGDPPQWEGDQLESIRHYQADGHEQINAQLRLGRGRDPVGGKMDDIFNMDDAIARSPAFENDVRLFRGVGDDVFPDDIPAGTELVDNGFASTSRRAEKGASFAAANDGKMIEIRAPAGTKSLDMSGFRKIMAQEQEQILARRSKIRFTGERYVYEGETGSTRQIETWVAELVPE